MKKKEFSSCDTPNSTCLNNQDNWREYNLYAKVTSSRSYFEKIKWKTITENFDAKNGKREALGVVWYSSSLSLNSMCLKSGQLKRVQSISRRIHESFHDIYKADILRSSHQNKCFLAKKPRGVEHKLRIDEHANPLNWK